MNQEIIKRAGDVINAKRDYIGGGMEGHVVLSLIDENGYPTSAAITLSKADGIKWLSFLGDTNSNKTKRIAKCNKACVCLASAEYNITLVGKAEVITDPAIKKEHWQDVFSQYHGDWQDPECCAIRFTTESYNIYFASDDSVASGEL